MLPHSPRRSQPSEGGRIEPKEKPPGVCHRGVLLRARRLCLCEGKRPGLYEASTVLTLLLLCFLLLGWGFLLRLASLFLHRHKNLLAAVTTLHNNYPTTPFASGVS